MALDALIRSIPVDLKFVARRTCDLVGGILSFFVSVLSVILVRRFNMDDSYAISSHIKHKLYRCRSYLVLSLHYT